MDDSGSILKSNGGLPAAIRHLKQPRRPHSAFSRWCIQARPAMEARKESLEGDEEKNFDVNEELARAWKELPDKEQGIWQAEYDEEQTEYRKQKDEYNRKIREAKKKLDKGLPLDDDEDMEGDGDGGDAEGDDRERGEMEQDDDDGEGDKDKDKEDEAMDEDVEMGDSDK
jgi:non-histone protein 10